MSILGEMFLKGPIEALCNCAALMLTVSHPSPLAIAGTNEHCLVNSDTKSIAFSLTRTISQKFGGTRNGTGDLSVSGSILNPLTHL